MALRVFDVSLIANAIRVSYCWPYSFHSDCVVNVVGVAVVIIVLLLVKYSESAGCLCVLCVLVRTRLAEEDFSCCFGVGTKFVDQDFSFVCGVETGLVQQHYSSVLFDRIEVDSIVILIGRVHWR